MAFTLNFWISSIGILCIFKLMSCYAQTPPKVVSQCYRQQGFSFVSLYCGYNKLIQIEVAYHGRHKNARIQHCGELQEDCTKDTTNMYDWSKCEGKHSCVQMIKSTDMSNECNKETGVQYLQVEYVCVPLPSSTDASFEEEDDENSIDATVPTEKRGKKGRKKGRKKAENAILKEEGAEMYDICVNTTLSQQADSVYIHSPGYPKYYMANTDCRCAVQAPPKAQVAVTYHDLALVMRAKQCVDWLLLQSPGHKASTAVTCGHLNSQSGDKEEKEEEELVEQPKRTVLSHANWLLMHFHTAQVNDNQLKKSMPGFKVQIQAVPKGPINIKCYSVHPDILNSLRKKGRDDSTSLILPASDLDTISVSDAVISGASTSLTTWTGFVTIVTLLNTVLLRLVLS